MITSPEPSSSKASTLETSSASQSSMHDFGLTYFTFWDMDDTSVDLNTNSIKNAHLLLPIMLYQTHAPNQHLGIMTNRSPEDTGTGYPVKKYVTDLSQFGINIPSSQIIFGGGQNNHPATQELYKLQAAIEVISQQLRSLELTAGPDLSAKILGTDPKKTHFDQLIGANFAGKNFLINTFINKSFSRESGQFHFEKGVCHRKALKVCLVDDLDTIAGVASQLGDNFIGIKAARGGNAPYELVYKSEKDDFYQDEYLFTVANTIGLRDYANNLINDPARHGSDDVMLQMAALVYAWQAFPKQMTMEHIIPIAKRLSPKQLEQMAQLLTYIDCHANTHRDAHYRSIQKIAKHFREASDTAFLATASEMIFSLRQRILALTIARTEVPEEPKKGLGSFFKTRSHGSALKVPSRASIERAQVEQLQIEEQALLARVREFLTSRDLALASQAQRILGADIAPGSVLLFSSPASSSSSALPPLFPPPLPIDSFPGLSQHRTSSSSPRLNGVPGSDPVALPLPLPLSSTDPSTPNSARKPRGDN